MSELRFPSRIGPAAALLERAPTWALQYVAVRHARIRPLGRQPGWRFDLPNEDTSPETSFRRELWEVFREEGARRPIKVPWYDRLEVRLYLGNDLSYCLYIGGSFEPNEFAFLSDVLRPGMTVVDGGANEGLYSLFMARRVGKHGRVLAFEPSSRELERLRANISLNRLTNVDVRAAALGSEQGTAELAVAERGHEGQNTIGHKLSNPKVRTQRHESVAVESIDEIADDLSLDRLDLIKLDIEGSELRALAGARRAIERFQPLLLIEVETERLVPLGATREELVALIRSLGYEVFVFDRETARLRHPVGPEEPDGSVVAAPAGWLPPVL